MNKAVAGKGADPRTRDHEVRSLILPLLEPKQAVCTGIFHSLRGKLGLHPVARRIRWKRFNLKHLDMKLGNDVSE